MKLGNGWNIQYNQKSVSITVAEDWDYWHDESGDEYLMYGTEKTHEACIEKIKDIELEHPYFNEET